MVLIFTDTAFKTRRIGAYRIASALRNENVEVEVIDHLASWDYNELIAALDKVVDISWIGFSASYLHYFSDNSGIFRITDLEYAREQALISYIRSRGIPIVIGGSNADILKNNILGYYVVVGYADAAIIKIHEHITTGSSLIFTEINTNKVVYADVDYSATLENTETQFIETDFIANSRELLPLEISRGCIFRCAFCEFSHLGKKPGTYIRYKEHIKSEIECLYNTYGIYTFLFMDDTFNDCVEKMQMIKEIREETGIPFTFWAYGRLDLLARFPEMVDLIGETGWNAFTFGIETLNKKTGSSVGKGADPEKLKQCLIDLKLRYPYIHIQANLIVGLPHSTREDIKESVDWFLEAGVTDYLRVVDLDIKDSRNTLHGSMFSNNPTKFGFRLLSSDGLRYNWENDGFTRASAKEYANEINNYITDNKKKNIPYHSKYYVNQLISDNSVAGSIKKTFFEVSDDTILYIRKKKEYLTNLKS